MNESVCQRKVIQALRSSGSSVQKISDQFGIGIPDLVVGAPAAGMWIEMKYREKWPVRQSTALLPLDSKHGISGNQVAWLRSWWMRPLPTCVLLAFEDGSWLLVPAPMLSDATGGQAEAFLPLLQRTPLTRLTMGTLNEALSRALSLHAEGR